MAERSLLVEIGTEELPIHAVDELAQAFVRGVCERLTKRGIAHDATNVRAFCTPRRLAVHVPAVAAQQPEQRSEVLGPYLDVALDAQNQPTKALLGFAQRAGVEWTQLERASDGKGERFAHRAVTPGAATATIVPAIIAEALAALPIGKPMRWGNHDYAFARPVHWLVMLHGDRVIEGAVLGLRSGRQSRGHRFMHPQPVHLADADSYVEALRGAKVLADPVARRARIREEVQRAAHGLGAPRLDDALLDEIANLTEWPAAIACAFDRDYLVVPHEALVTTMVANQKFVPVFDADGKLTEHFIGVANIDSKDPAQVRHGYERVIRPRFADARFFFDEDLKTPLARHQQELQHVTYQKALGSLWDKTVRVAELARGIANRLRDQGVEVDAAQTAHAAGLSRCDLMTRMVGEFPELQGTMGRHYAQAQGEPAAIAQALDSFYAPRQSGDAIAPDRIGQVLAVADRLDTLAGGFAAGLKPSGNKDPFALRRAALGLARTLIEGQLDLDLDVLLREALEQIPDAAFAVEAKAAKGNKLADANVGSRRAALAIELRDFTLDRLRGYYAEHGFAANQFDAVAAIVPASLVDFDRRLRAVAAFAQRTEAAQLAAANKRVANILRKENIDAQAAAAHAIDASLLRESAERALAEALAAAHGDCARWLDRSAAQRDYPSALARLAQLQQPVDAFFDTVLVMAYDPALRANRLALLARIKAQFDAIADLALL